MNVCVCVCVCWQQKVKKVNELKKQMSRSSEHEKDECRFLIKLYENTMAKSQIMTLMMMLRRQRKNKENLNEALSRTKKAKKILQYNSSKS